MYNTGPVGLDERRGFGWGERKYILNEYVLLFLSMGLQHPRLPFQSVSRYSGL